MTPLYRLWLGPGKASQPMTLADIVAIARASTPNAIAAARGDR